MGLRSENKMIIHFKRRFLERYGEQLEHHHIDDIIINVLGGQAKFIESKTEAVKVFDIKLNNNIYRIMYDVDLNIPVTAIT